VLTDLHLQGSEESWVCAQEEHGVPKEDITAHSILWASSLWFEPASWWSGHWRWCSWKQLRRKRRHDPGCSSLCTDLRAWAQLNSSVCAAVLEPVGGWPRAEFGDTFGPERAKEEGPPSHADPGLLGWAEAQCRQPDVRDLPLRLWGWRACQGPLQVQPWVPCQVHRPVADGAVDMPDMSAIPVWSSTEGLWLLGGEPGRACASPLCPRAAQTWRFGHSLWFLEPFSCFFGVTWSIKDWESRNKKLWSLGYCQSIWLVHCCWWKKNCTDFLSFLFAVLIVAGECALENARCYGPFCESHFNVNL
jgi:hypothetical protein